MYQIFIERRAVKFLEKLAEADYSKIKTSILQLASNPRPSGCKKLRGRLAYRIRQGDYRIIYEIFYKVLKINIITIGHRSDVYNS